jgi:hypothetical protein
MKGNETVTSYNLSLLFQVSSLCMYWRRVSQFKSDWWLIIYLKTLYQIKILFSINWDAGWLGLCMSNWKERRLKVWWPWGNSRELLRMIMKHSSEYRWSPVRIRIVHIRMRVFRFTVREVIDPCLISKTIIASIFIQRFTYICLTFNTESTSEHLIQHPINFSPSQLKTTSCT